MIKRARIQIIHTILECLEASPDSEICVTKLLFLTGLSHDTLKSYLAVLADNNLVAIRQPTREQLFLRPAIKRYVVSTRKSEIFLKLYEESRREDLIWWETTTATTQAQSTIQTTTHHSDEKPKEGEERQKTARQYNLFGRSRTQ